MSTNDAKRPPEELILYTLLVIVGAIPVVVALVEHRAFGVAATLGFLMVCAGAMGALAHGWRSHGRRTE